MTMQASSSLSAPSWSTRGFAVMHRRPDLDTAAADPALRPISLRVVVPLVATTSLLLWAGLIAAGWYLLAT